MERMKGNKSTSEMSPLRNQDERENERSRLKDKTRERSSIRRLLK
jgi:hypothetical protein